MRLLPWPSEPYTPKVVDAFSELWLYGVLRSSPLAQQDYMLRAAEKSDLGGAEQRRGDATLSDEFHAEHREGRGDVEAERFWGDHYRQRGRVWSGRKRHEPANLSGRER